MSGYNLLSEEERKEILQDAGNEERGKAFLAARRKSHEGGLDEYIDFLSENIGLLDNKPTIRKTDDFRL